MIGFVLLASLLKIVHGCVPLDPSKFSYFQTSQTTVLPSSDNKALTTISSLVHFVDSLSDTDIDALEHGSSKAYFIQTGQSCLLVSEEFWVSSMIGVLAQDTASQQERLVSAPIGTTDACRMIDIAIASHILLDTPIGINVLRTWNDHFNKNELKLFFKTLTCADYLKLDRVLVKTFREVDVFKLMEKFLSIDITSGELHRNENNIELFVQNVKQILGEGEFEFEDTSADFIFNLILLDMGVTQFHYLEKDRFVWKFLLDHSAGAWRKVKAIQALVRGTQQKFLSSLAQRINNAEITPVFLEETIPQIKHPKYRKGIDPLSHISLQAFADARSDIVITQFDDSIPSQLWFLASLDNWIQLPFEKMRMEVLYVGQVIHEDIDEELGSCTVAKYEWTITRKPGNLWGPRSSTGGDMYSFDSETESTTIDEAMYTLLAQRLLSSAIPRDQTISNIVNLAQKMGVKVLSVMEMDYGNIN